MGFKSTHTDRSILRKASDKLGLSPPYSLSRQGMEHWGRLRRWGDRAAPQASAHIPIGVFSPFFIDERHIRKLFRSLPDGYFAKGHIPYHRDTAHVIEEENIRVVSIIRDPRAVIASLIPYVIGSSSARHNFLEVFSSKDKDEVVEFILQGGSIPERGIPFRPLSQCIHEVLEWSERGQSQLVRFEDLVGRDGGSSIAQQMMALQKLASYLKCEPDIEEISTKIFDRTSPTFRSGRIDSWKHDLSEHSQRMIVDSLGNELFQRLGYEANGA